MGNWQCASAHVARTPDIIEERLIKSTYWRYGRSDIPF